MGERKALAAVWRFLFYLLRPRNPFIMRTRDYRLFAHPRKGTLTRAVIRRGYWEPLETEIFRGLLRSDSLVIDAGANFGHYALTAANMIGPNGLVIAFEPHPDTFALIDANCGLLPHDNFVAIQAGLGAFDGTMELYSDSANPGGHSFYEWNLRGTKEFYQSVQVYSLDSFLSEQGHVRPVDVIKIDVQGFEMEVLRGAARTIERDQPAILCEVTPEALSSAGSSVEELFGFFRTRGYRAEVLLPDDDRIQAMDYLECIEFFGKSEAEYHDILFQSYSKPTTK
jgi:FkbM family methyltransferase